MGPHLYRKNKIKVSKVQIQGAIQLVNKKYKWVIFISLLVVLTSCNNAQKEAETYVDQVYEDAIKKNKKAEISMEEFFNSALAAEHEDAFAILNERVIPEHEELANILNQAELTKDDLIDFNNLALEVTKYSKETFEMLHTIFENITDNQDDVANINLDTQLDALYDRGENLLEKKQTFEEELDELIEEYDSFQNIESTFLKNDSINAAQMNEQYEELVMVFLESVAGSSSSEEASNDEFLEQGNPEVIFNGEIAIDETFLVKGKSNLPEGAQLQLSTYHYGSENPYLKDDIEVESDGTFHFEIDVETDELTKEPIEVRIEFIPHKHTNEPFQDMYGKEGEKLTGPFIQKVTSSKRTRNAAIVSAHIEFEAGAQASLEKPVWNPSNDYGDLNIWMKDINVDIHEQYYDITINSNLLELTGISATIEVPGYDVAGYTSRANVLPDGSFRFQIPRPDVNDKEIIVIIEATSSRAIETEELYGEKGEKFEGSLVDKTDKRQTIKYTFHIEDKS